MATALKQLVWSGAAQIEGLQPGRQVSLQQQSFWGPYCIAHGRQVQRHAYKSQRLINCSAHHEAGSKNGAEPVSQHSKVAGELQASPLAKSGDSAVWELMQTGATGANEAAEPATWGEAPPQRLVAEDVTRDREANSLMSQRSASGFMNQLKHLQGRLLYQYYNWRTDTWSDLQLLAGLNVVLLLTGSFIKHVLVDPVEGFKEGFWTDIYAILKVVFGQELPDVAASTASQLFAVAVATTGLAAFALVLALVEQVVLEVIESNVKLGSRVFEEGHILLLAWGENRKDLSVVEKILTELCMAYRNDGGRVVVVLSRQEKLAMEEHFYRAIPPSSRYGSKIVFRQGSPLVPADLRLVSASTAAATCVVSDSSRYPEEADAQSVRCAVLLDELDFKGYGVDDPRKGQIIVELKTSNALALAQYSCSRRIIPLPTTQLNARRMARMVKSPMSGLVSYYLWSFESMSQGYLETYPQLVGRKFREAAFYFPNAVIAGLVNPVTGRSMINAPVDTIIEPGDAFIMMRPTTYARGEFQPTPKPVVADVGEWDPVQYDPEPLKLSASQQALMGELRRGPSAGSAAAEPQTNLGIYMLPVEYSSSSEEPQRVLICGWGETSFMSSLLRELDRGPVALPPGSEVVLFNPLERERVMNPVRERAGVQYLSILHVQGNPLFRLDLQRKLDVAKYNCVIVLCDMSWLDPDMDRSNGISGAEQSDMLRMDAMVMTVQLNIRHLLQEQGVVSVNIITEKLAFEGVTRFEDRSRLPLGMTVNFTGYSAKLLTQMAYNPQVLAPFSQLGLKEELKVQDSSAFAALGEKLTYWQLLARAQTVQQVLFGYYIVPASIDAPIEFVMNPSAELRNQKRVWNNGSMRIKLFTLAPKLQVERTLDSMGSMGSSLDIASGSAAAQQPVRV